MRTSKNGIELIKSFEGVKLTAYKAVPTEQYYTIGYGHYGMGVKQGMVITHAQAEAYLINDLRKFEASVNNLNMTFTQNQFDALVSFAYNCGTRNLKKLVAGRSTLEIADAMLLYTKSGGRELKGLVKRRKKERELFLMNDDIMQIAGEVIAGMWGNGATRKRKLTEAGYNYNEVQRCVNKLLTGEK